MMEECREVLWLKSFTYSLTRIVIMYRANSNIQALIIACIMIHLRYGV